MTYNRICLAALLSRISTESGRGLSRGVAQLATDMFWEGDWTNDEIVADAKGLVDEEAFRATARVRLKRRKGAF